MKNHGLRKSSNYNFSKLKKDLPQFKLCAKFQGILNQCDHLEEKLSENQVMHIHPISL